VNPIRCRCFFRLWIWPRVVPAACILALWMSLAAAPCAAYAADDKPVDAAAQALSDFEETWQVMYMGKARVGYTRSSSGRTTRDGRDVIVSDAENTTSIARFGQTVKIRVLVKTEETAAGELIGYQFEMQNPPAAPTLSTGRVDGEKLVITTETNGKAKTKEIPWDGTVKAPNYQDRVLQKDPLKPGEKRTFKTFEPQVGSVITVTLEAGGKELRDVQLLDGKIKKLLEVKMTLSIMPGIATYEYLDEKGTPLKTKVSLFNVETVSYAVSKEEALKALSGAEVDLAVATLVKTEKKIDRARDARQVVYRVTIPGEDPESIISKGATQLITRVNPNSIDLTVRAISPPAPAPENSEPPGKEFLTPNVYLQSDDELVKKHAADAVGD